MNRENIAQIIKDLFKDNMKAYPALYSGMGATTNARACAMRYWNWRTDEEIERDTAAGISVHDYASWCVQELMANLD